MYPKLRVPKYFSRVCKIEEDNVQKCKRKIIKMPNKPQIQTVQTLVEIDCIVDVINQYKVRSNLFIYWSIWYWRIWYNCRCYVWCFSVQLHTLTDYSIVLKVLLDKLNKSPISLMKLLCLKDMLWRYQIFSFVKVFYDAAPWWFDKSEIDFIRSETTL